MSCNTHMTLLTNLSQFQRLSHLSHPHHTHIKFHIRIHQIPSMLHHVFPTSIYSNPSLSSCFTSVLVPNYCPLLSHYCFLSQIIVLSTSFKNTPYVSYCV